MGTELKLSPLEFKDLDYIFHFQDCLIGIVEPTRCGSSALGRKVRKLLFVF
jgi:hypothetical protein